MYLIRLLLPLHDNQKKEFPAADFVQIRGDLTERFGGATAFVRAPAVGLWKEEDDEVVRDEVVLFEVMADRLDREWWAGYRLRLQSQFRQKELVVWASAITRL